MRMTVRRRSVRMLVRNCSVVVHALTKHEGTKRDDASGRAPAARNCDGVSPTIAVKVRLNVLRLAKPTTMQMSVTF